jgi:hypothetical protein
MLLLSSFLTAGNGKISGVVKDSLGKPVPGAKISIPDMKISTISDDDGRYFILNVPPGKYDIVVNAVGYNQKKIISVKVISDLTTEINVSLEPASVEAEEIAINADRNLINKTMASSKTIYSADDLAKTFPTSNTFEILQTSPSIYKGFLRGGLQNQTKFLVDGVDISDSYYTSAGDRTLTTFNSFVPIVRYRERPR